MKKILAIISAVALLTACSPPVHHVKHDTNIVHAYHYHNKVDNTWLYYYILTSNSGTYYYRSPSIVSNFSSVNFTKAPSTGLPNEVKEEIAESEQLSEQAVPQEEIPQEIVQEELQIDTTEAQSEAMTNEGGPAPAETTSDTSSSDSGGGGDSGGGSSD